MREAGYKKYSVNKPKQLTDSDSWQKLMDEYMSEEKLAQVHSEGLSATKPNGNKPDTPDYGVRHKYMETGYKLRKKLDNSPTGIGMVGIFSLADLSRKRNEVLEAEIIEPESETKLEVTMISPPSHEKHVFDGLIENGSIEPDVEGENGSPLSLIDKEV